MAAVGPASPVHINYGTTAEAEQGCKVWVRRRFLPGLQPPGEVGEPPNIPEPGVDQRRNVLQRCGDAIVTAFLTCISHTCTPACLLKQYNGLDPHNKNETISAGQFAFNHNVFGPGIFLCAAPNCVAGDAAANTLTRCLGSCQGMFHVLCLRGPEVAQFNLTSNFACNSCLSIQSVEAAMEKLYMTRLNAISNLSETRRKEHGKAPKNTDINYWPHVSCFATGAESYPSARMNYGITSHMGGIAQNWNEERHKVNGVNGNSLTNCYQEGKPVDPHHILNYATGDRIAPNRLHVINTYVTKMATDIIKTGETSNIPIERLSLIKSISNYMHCLVVLRDEAFKRADVSDVDLLLVSCAEGIYQKDIHVQPDTSLLMTNQQIITIAVTDVNNLRTAADLAKSQSLSNLTYAAITKHASDRGKAAINDRLNWTKRKGAGGGATDDDSPLDPAVITDCHHCGKPRFDPGHMRASKKGCGAALGLPEGAPATELVKGHGGFRCGLDACKKIKATHWHDDCPYNKQSVVYDAALDAARTKNTGKKKKGAIKP
jgi:hypothetical protein